ncbi:gas vesicle protein [Streptomyces peucetius]|uniref:Gas vesicle protein n=1 Tax=Streptomyces peucetius TaxID=1950 RepID=A0ABY6HZW1_STRPE|nr:gas vesicle protein [Streptomyces peucetius]UYQ60260.1 gas vesicle protein [Streptomyces peucetius]
MGRTAENRRNEDPGHNEPNERRNEDSEHNEGNDDTQRRERRTVRSVEVLRAAREQLAELTGMTAETVSSFARTPDGWRLVVEVLELARVPDTTSLLASYEVEVDSEGELTSYRRTRRYERGRADRPSS